MLRWLLVICLCFLGFMPLAHAQEEAEEEGRAVAPEEIITEDEMYARLAASADGELEDILYIKIGDEVEVHRDLCKKRSWRKMLVTELPVTEMLRLYTANKVTHEQMAKMLFDYEDSNANFDGYRVITDRETTRELENGVKVYRSWFMKIERDKVSRGRRFPVGLGVGIGRHGPRPWIGIGL